jgi:hypothetical protein
MMLVMIRVCTYKRGIPGGALNLNSTGYPDHDRCGDIPLQGKITTSEPEIEPGTSWLVVRSSGNQATKLVRFRKRFKTRQIPRFRQVTFQFLIEHIQCVTRYAFLSRSE